MSEWKEWENYNPRRVPLARLAREFKRELERFGKKAYQFMRDQEHNDDDPDWYKYSAFFANADSAGQIARDVVEDWKEIET